MKAPAKPENEWKRLDYLYRLDILDTSEESDFDDLTRLAAIQCGTLFSTVSLIDKDRQWFKSIEGPLGVSETSRDVSFCGHAILQDQLFVIEDALLDERFKDNPFVTEGPKVRFYAGAPLTTSEGYVLGTLCVFDTKPGKLTDEQKEALTLLAHQVTERIEQRTANTLLEHLGSVLDISSTYVVMFDPFLERVLYINPTLRHRLRQAPSVHSRELLQQLFPDLRYDRLFIPDRLRSIQQERRKFTRVELSDLTDGRAEVRILPHLTGGRHTCVLLFNDQSELNRVQQQYQQSEIHLKVFSKVAMQSQNAVIITDAEGRIEWVNDSFKHHTGYGWSEAKGQKPGDFLQGPDTSQQDRERISRHLKAGKAVVQEILNYRKSGEAYWVELFIEPIHDDTGGLTHFMATQSDVTHRKVQEQTVRASREAAERANRSKSRFLANISHELRTPLNGIVGVADELKAKIPANLASSVETLDHSARHLLTVLNDLIELSHIESGMMILNENAFDVEALVHEVEQLYHPRAEAVGTQLTVEFLQVPKARYLSDVTRLKQVLMNLVNNAINFTHNGDVCIRVDIESADQSIHTMAFDMLRFTVSDTGPGISQEDQERIFESFEQLDQDTLRTRGGSGLGLAISRQIVRAMGSDIAVYSESGSGATFAFELKLPREDGKEPVTAQPTKVPSERPVSTIMVIDDDDVTQGVLKEMLERIGVRRVQAVSSAQQALDQLVSLGPDLLIVDQRMPTMNGSDFLKSARELWSASNVQAPLTIACTADATDSNRQACLDAGFDAFLGKPVSGSSLTGVLDELGVQIVDETVRKSASKAVTPQSGSDAKAEVLPRVDLESLRQAFLENDTLLIGFLELLLEHLPTYMARIEEALSHDRIENLYEDVHSLKGLVGYFKDPVLLRDVSAFEQAVKLGESTSAEMKYGEVQAALERLLEDVYQLMLTLTATPESL